MRENDRKDVGKAVRAYLNEKTGGLCQIGNAELYEFTRATEECGWELTKLLAFLYSELLILDLRTRNKKAVCLSKQMRVTEAGKDEIIKGLGATINALEASLANYEKLPAARTCPNCGERVKCV